MQVLSGIKRRGLVDRRKRGGRNGAQNTRSAYAEPIGIDAAAALLGRSTAGARNYRDVALCAGWFVNVPWLLGIDVVLM